jgi:ABC-2 type transport system permease protein
MLALLRKEINIFLGSLIGYIVIAVFLLAIGLFMWVFKGSDFNILENGYANIDSLFVLAPWVFMFLVPAVTMRSFAEEKKSGTIELLMTQPVSDTGIIFAKYLSGLILVIFSLLPTLIYFITVYYLASPAGNIDVGGIIGSYIGLLLLASGFVAIGIFASSLTDNQVIAFIISMFLCFFWHIGFESLSSLSLFGGLDSILLQLGINSHYSSISRGVIDSRDVVYFISLTGFFILLTRFMLEKRKW